MKRTIIHLLSHSVCLQSSVQIDGFGSAVFPRQSAISAKFSRFESFVQSLQSRVRQSSLVPFRLLPSNFVVFSIPRKKWAESLIARRATGNPRSWRRKNPSSGDGTHNRERNCCHSQVVIFPPKQYIHYLPVWYFVPNCVPRDLRSFLLVSLSLVRPTSTLSVLLGKTSLCSVTEFLT